MANIIQFNNTSISAGGPGVYAPIKRKFFPALFGGVSGDANATTITSNRKYNTVINIARTGQRWPRRYGRTP